MVLLLAGFAKYSMGPAASVISPAAEISGFISPNLLGPLLLFSLNLPTSVVDGET